MILMILSICVGFWILVMIIGMVCLSIWLSWVENVLIWVGVVGCVMSISVDGCVGFEVM